ncbi:Rhamnolipids biosynthesis 3-oxoacyl-[acyl-carrier-protein] reductase [Variovorax sp. SRS16]|nr:Rhamnolipids biosynthesis 3-oxoacyl-[acyl-carrier-protein] reductase [Variovorax sp. SRS16]
MLRLDGKAFVVLGAGQGIGEQSAHALAQCGARVLCVDSNEARARAIAEATRGVPCVADVTSRADIQKVFAMAASEFGNRLDGIVDVVGIGVGKTLETLDDSSWQRQFDLVVGHAFLAIQMGAPLLVPGASIVLVGSMAGSWVRGGELLAYASAKAALHHLARGAAQDLAPRRIRVNVVAPGLTRTPRLLDANDEEFWQSQAAEIPLGRAGSPSDIASAILFLASPMATHITGVVLPVDGGAGIGMLRPMAKSASRPATAPGRS